MVDGSVSKSEMYISLGKIFKLCCLSAGSTCTVWLRLSKNVSTRFERKMKLCLKDKMCGR